MKIVFLGTPDFAVPTLERLLASGHDVVGVVTQPDRRKGRGQRVSAPPVKVTAAECGVVVFQPETLRAQPVVTAFESWAPDLCVVAAYGKLIPDNLLAMPRLGMINVHASLLPSYRGAAPIHRAVMAGDEQTGITIIKLVSQMDAGPMLSHAAIPIGSDDTSAIVERRLAKLGADLLERAVDDLARDRAVFEEQDHARATFAPRIVRSDGLIDWTRAASDIHNQVRGLHPWPHAFTFVNGTRVMVHRASVGERPEGADGAALREGQVAVAEKDHLLIAAGEGTALAVHDLQPEGKRLLSVREFLAGRPLAVGTVFSSTA